MYIYIYLFTSWALGIFFSTKFPLNWHPLNPMESQQKKKTFHLEELAMPAQPVSSVKLQPTSPKVGDFTQKFAARVSFVAKKFRNWRCSGCSLWRFLSCYFLKMMMTSDIDTLDSDFLGVDPRLESPHSSGHLGAILSFSSSKHRDFSVWMSSFPYAQVISDAWLHPDASVWGRGPWHSMN